LCNDPCEVALLKWKYMVPINKLSSTLLLVAMFSTLLRFVFKTFSKNAKQMLGGFGIEPSHTQRVENSYAKDAGGKASEAVDYTPTF
jgi:hypothetical protein